MFEIRNVSSDEPKYCCHCEGPAVYQIWICDPRIIQPQAALTLCKPCMKVLHNFMHIALREVKLKKVQ